LSITMRVEGRGRSRLPAAGHAFLAQILTLSAMFALQIVVALYMQRVLGYGALDTGLAMLPAAVAIGGMAVGVAVLSTLAARRTEELLSAGESAASALTGGYHLAFGIAAALLGAAFAVALVVLRQPGRVRRG